MGSDSQVLAKNGFNAIFPNFLWGYVADYPSEVLPNHPGVITEQGKIDYLQHLDTANTRSNCVSGKSTGIWGIIRRKTAQKMQILGRTQMTCDGRDGLSGRIIRRILRSNAIRCSNGSQISGGWNPFDYIRYPDNTTDFSFDARAFEQFLGRPVQNWPADCVLRVLTTRLMPNGVVTISPDW